MREAKTGRRKLRGDKVALMRLLYSSFLSLKQNHLATMFGVSEATISRTLSGKTHQRIK